MFISKLRHSPSRTLLQTMSDGYLWSLSSKCVITSLLLAVVLSPGCSGTPLIEQESGEKPEQPLEHTADQVRITVKKSARSTTLRTDLFVFDAAGQREAYFNFTDSSDVHTISASCGEKSIVAIVNSPYNFNEQAIAKLESLELVKFKFKDDSPTHMAMSGISGCTVADDGETVELEIPVTPLMCHLTLTDVSNNLSGYRRLENPRVRLLSINPEAEILRVDGFRPIGDAIDGETVFLPCDIGFYTQYPGTTLYCYPDETPENMLGTERTRLMFECEIHDTTRQFEIPLPTMPRGSDCPISLTVDETPENTYICTHVSTSPNTQRSSTPHRQNATQGALCQRKISCMADR